MLLVIYAYRGTILILPSVQTTCCGVKYFRRSMSADFLRVEEISISSGIGEQRDLATHNHYITHNTSYTLDT
jgi:hypothetical protein